MRVMHIGHDAHLLQPDAVIRQGLGEVMHVCVPRAARQDLIPDHKHGGGGHGRSGIPVSSSLGIVLRPGIGAGPCAFKRPFCPRDWSVATNASSADVVLEDGREVTAHCPNPGAMMGLAEPGMRVWLEPNDDPRKKLKFGWRLVELAGRSHGRDRHRRAQPHRGRGAGGGADRSARGYGGIRPEQRYGENSRIDFLLSEPGRPDAYVEVKNVHLRRDGDWAEFPDCVTARGAKHLGELSRIAQGGGRAVMLYVVQRTDCGRFRLAPDLDPGLCAAFDAARDGG
jgi:sugar fermentation stimulation protein A